MMASLLPKRVASILLLLFLTATPSTGDADQPSFLDAFGDWFSGIFQEDDHRIGGTWNWRWSPPPYPGYGTCTQQPFRLRNWGGNFMFGTQNIQYPRTVAEVQQIVKCARKLRALGNRHSYSEVANSDDTLISLMYMSSVISFNATVPSVTVQAGITYTDLAPALYANGYALRNTAILEEITVAGAAQTCVHGSGLDNQNLGTQIRAMQLVLANGTVANYGPGSQELKAMACGLGAFGVITQLELKLEPTYNVTNYEFVDMPIENFYGYFEAIHQLGYSVNMFTYQYGTGIWEYVNIAAKSGSAQDNGLNTLTSLFNATRSTSEFSQSYPIFSKLNTAQPWYAGLPIYQPGLSGLSANEIQTEYFVPLANAVPAMKAVEKLASIIQPVFTVHLVRTVATDDLWMSQYQGANKFVSIHFSWQNNMTALLPVLAQLEAALEPFAARPHWAKFFTMSPNKFLKYYPKLSQFKQLAAKLDPTQKFRNKFLDENVFF